MVSAIFPGRPDSRSRAAGFGSQATMLQMIYASQPFGFDRSVLAGILVGARRYNAEHDITGALICRQDIYLQLLEGPPEAIEPLYARIARDDRHQDVTLLRGATVEERLFPQWAMFDDPARSWLWSPADVAAGVPMAAGPEAAQAVFVRLAAETAAG